MSLSWFPVLEVACRFGATVFFVDHGHFFEGGGENRRRIMELAEMRLDSSGIAMAAVAACRALGTGVAQIRAGLRTFRTVDRNSTIEAAVLQARS